MSEEKNPEKVKKKKKEKKPEVPVILPPAFWLALLALPVLYALGAYIFRDDEPLPPENQVVVVQEPAPSATPSSSRARYSSRRRKAEVQTISAEQVKACAFDDWIGRPVKANLLRRSGFAYRLISAGYGDTVRPTGDPMALNVEVGEGNIVTKVWCG
ncbi:MAG: hypothetical protein DHS20C02_00630 [Micavibrio sp.]|nr:MAG: hypothetical protein DHS20C02_00630 [Micavibrio sp.]